jgi:hypothetical protein
VLTADTALLSISAEHLLGHFMPQSRNDGFEDFPENFSKGVDEKFEKVHAWSYVVHRKLVARVRRLRLV